MAWGTLEREKVKYMHGILVMDLQQTESKTLLIINMQEVEEIKTGDIIDMILDLNKLQINTFVLNDEDQGIAFGNIEKTSYKAAVDIWHDKDGSYTPKL